jgi:hypothetical protein
VNQSSVAGETSTKKMKTVQLKELGPQLPLGLVDAKGSWAKDIATRPWRMKEERELGALRDQNRDANVAMFVGMVLGAMCTKLGANDLESIKSTERRIIVSQMFTGDVFYAYIWLRVQAIGSELQMQLTCPNCSSKFPFDADLESVEVTTVEKLEDAQWTYELANPFTLRGQQLTKLLLGPSRWNGLEMMGPSGLNTGAAKAGMIRSSIHAIYGKDGKPMAIALTDTELDEMSKRDLERITTQIEKNHVGPNMAVEGKCEKCRAAFKMPIDWGYDSFFGSSGR